MRSVGSPDVPTLENWLWEAVEVYEINVQTLHKIAESQQPDTVKVFNLLKSIENAVREQAGVSPYLLSIGERAEAIADAFKQRQIPTQEALSQLEYLTREINEARQDQAERNISAESFTAYWLLKTAGVEAAESVAAKMQASFAKYPHRRTGEQQAWEARRALYGALGKGDVKDVPALAEQVMSVLLRERP